MANNKLSAITISFTKRNARNRGPTSSEAWNDNSDELVRDLTGLYSEWNNSLIPLLSLLPGDGDGFNVDAFTDGLDGRTMFVNTDATASVAANYYNSGQTRPNTLYEQFQSVYSYIETKVNTVQDQVDNVALAAIDVPIADSGSVFSSGNVEGALQEVMNLVARTGTDHGSLTGLGDDDHTQYLPRTGSRAMTGNLQMGTKDITNAGALNGTTLSISSTGVINNGFSIGGTLSVVGATTLSTANITTDNVTTLVAGTGQIEMLANLTTTSGTVTLDTATTGGKIYTNTGASGLVTYNLPSVSAVSNKGLWYRFYVNNANGIKVKAQTGDTIRLNTSVSASGGNVQATALGCAITVMFMSNGVWAAISHEGSWTVT